MKEKIITIATILMGIIALIQIYEWTSKLFLKELTANITYGEYKLPPEIGNEIRRLRHQSDRSNSDSLMTDMKLNLASMERIYGYYNINISNESNKALSNVKLNIPECKYAQAQFSDGHIVEYNTSNLISLGSLQPQEQCKLYAWSSYPVSSYSAERITLTHDAGIGDVSILVPIGGLGKSLDSFLPVIKYLFYILFFSVLVGILLSYLEAKFKGKSTKKGKIKAAG